MKHNNNDSERKQSFNDYHQSRSYDYDDDFDDDDQTGGSAHKVEVLSALVERKEKSEGCHLQQPSMMMMMIMMMMIMVVIDDDHG